MRQSTPSARKLVFILMLVFGILALTGCKQSVSESIVQTEDGLPAQVAQMKQYCMTINGNAVEVTSGIRDDGLAIIPVLEVMEALGHEVNHTKGGTVRITCAEDCFILNKSSGTLCPENDPDENLLLTPPGESRPKFFVFENEECYVDSARLQLFFQKLGLKLIIDHSERTVSIQTRGD